MVIHEEAVRKAKKPNGGAIKLKSLQNNEVKKQGTQQTKH